ncbi:MAG: guanitoxin biosynthesis heme-dependent pre-guanitoxin N-hydroxylase GntA [Ginsengibacter sp.]
MASYLLRQTYLLKDIEFMVNTDCGDITSEYFTYLKNREFPCIAAKAALARQQVKCMVSDHMACPKDDKFILQFLYDFVNEYRETKNFYQSAAVIFKGPLAISEELFDELLWQRLQALADLDAKNYPFDNRVNNAPSSPHFSFSIKEEALYIIGLHPNSSRQSRRFTYPSLIFNPHAQFEVLREINKFEVMKNVVRKRDIAYSGSVNPMLEDFGTSSEVYQYSGRKYDDSWQCPLKINHAKAKSNFTP